MDWNNTEGAIIQMPLLEKETVTELSGDYSLPDYQPEIKRLLHIRPVVLPPACYVGAGNAEISGNVDYYVLYMGNDGKLYCAPLTAEYGVTVPCEDAIPDTDTVTCHADCATENVTGRVSAARKLTIRCRLRTTVHICGNRQLSGGIDADVQNSAPETLQETCSTSEFLHGTGEILRVGDTIIPDNRNGEVRIVCAEGEILIGEIAAGNGAVNCRGELLLKLLIAGEAEEDTYQTLLRKIPFSQAVDLEGVTVNSQCCAKGCCTELSVEMTEDGIMTEAGILLDVFAQKNSTFTYLKDLYSTQKPTVCTYENLLIPQAQKCVNGNFTLSDSLPLQEAGIDPGAKILDISGETRYAKMRRERGMCQLAGTAVFWVLLRNPDGEMSSAEIELPFRYETDGGNASDCCADTHILTCRGRIDGERIGIDAEIAVAARFWSNTPITVLDKASFDGETVPRRGEYVLCYPAPNDTLWSVAKRYMRPISAVSAGNPLPTADSPDSPESLKGIKYLLV